MATNVCNEVASTARFETAVVEGVVCSGINVAMATLLVAHLRAAIEHLKERGRFVQSAVISFTERLATTAVNAEDVLENAAQPMQMGDEVRVTSAAYFTISVEADGMIELEMTSKAANLIARVLRDYRDWRWQQGYKLPGPLGAFGGNLATAGREAFQLMPQPVKPVLHLPRESRTQFESLKP